MSKRVKHKKPFFSVSYRIILIIFASALVVGYASIFINPAKFWIPSFFGLYFIPLVLANVVLMVIALVRRSGSFWIPFITLLPTLFFAEYYVQFGEKEQIHKSDELKLMTYNVGRFASGKDKMSSQTAKKQVIDFISQNHPDIICLQEFATRDTGDLAKAFPQYPYRQSHFFHLKKSGIFFGNLTLSKYPITDGGKITFKSSTNLTLYSDIKYRSHTIRVYNNHLESNNISLTSLIKKLGGNREDFSNELSEVHTKMRGSTHRRAAQVDIVLQHIRTSDYLSVICGDFNDNPMSFTFYRLKEARKDTFKEAGSGFASSYSTFWPLLRIDYILVPDSFEVLEHTTQRVPYSDHYPVISRITFNTDYDSGS